MVNTEIFAYARAGDNVTHARAWVTTTAGRSDVIQHERDCLLCALLGADDGVLQ